MIDKPRLILRAFLMTLLLSLGCATPAAAQNFENLDRLDSLVAMSMGANRGEPGGPVAPIDRRLRLAACPVTPVVDGPTLGAATVSCPSIGWRIRVPLVAGAAPATQLGAMPAEAAIAVIKRGDPVQLVAGSGGFRVSRQMIADEDGTVGALIRVRQDMRAAPVMARVERAGIVRIPGI